MATCPADGEQNDAGLIDNAALVYEDDRIVWVGSESQLPDQFATGVSVDCMQSLVIPGLIDCHTHLCFGGWRGDEFEMRLRGRSYQDIAAQGGGIANTVNTTRTASRERLQAKALLALQGILDLGVTTLECKSGYGLEPATELKQLEVYQNLNRCQAITLVPTFLGAHMVPAEYLTRRRDYINLLCDVLIPAVSDRKLAKFCDVFVEEGAFSIDEAREILASAKKSGLGLKIHADQLSHGGGAELAAELGAVSA